METLTLTNIRVLKRFSGIIAAALLVAVCFLGARPAAASSDDAIKAAYVFNFAKLVTWPSSSGTFVIGIVGNSSAGSAIETIVSGKSANGATISVKHISAGETSGCQLVFVCGSGGPGGMGGSGVLTVGEASGFAGGGGCMGFVTEDGKVRFEINNGAMKKAHLTADPKLMALAKSVG